MRRWLLLALPLLLTLLPAAGGRAQTPPQDTSGLHVAGGALLNAEGQTVQLRGVNRSSWEYTCFDGSGQTHDGPANQAEVTAMQSWHISVVRVVLNEDCWLGINKITVSAATYQQAVTAYVQLLTSNNIAVIVNLHYAAPGTILAGAYKSGDQFPMPDEDHSPAFWQSVAATFAGNSRVLFEPYNEPFPAGTAAQQWTCWRDGGTCAAVKRFPTYTVAGMQQLVDVIRAAGAQNPLILDGVNWASDVSQWEAYKPADPADQLIAGWHSYGDGLSCQTLSCWQSTLTPLSEQNPILATEIGEFDCKHAYIDKVMAYLDSVNQGYLAWVWGPYSCAGDPALIKTWSGTPTQSYGQGYHDHLISRGP